METITRQQFDTDTAVGYSERSSAERGRILAYERVNVTNQKWGELFAKYDAKVNKLAKGKLTLTTITNTSDYESTDGSKVEYTYTDGIGVELGSTGKELYRFTYHYDTETSLQLLLLGFELR